MNRKEAPREELSRLYRDMLIAKRRSVMVSLGVKGDTLAGHGRIAEEDQAPISHEAFIHSRLNTLEYTDLRLVNEALDRLKAGDYGVYMCCERPIPQKRLRALPWARYCVNCEEKIAARGSGDQEEDAAEPALIW